MTTSFDFRIEWLEAPGVATPELAATWARYEVWVGDRCVTQVETADGTFRRGVYGALYPLAYWIASNWWLLASHVRPSAVDTRYWTWQKCFGTFPWLRQHDLPGAGDGMAWPDLTLVPEGAVTRVVWSQEYRHRLAPGEIRIGRLQHRPFQRFPDRTRHDRRSCPGTSDRLGTAQDSAGRGVG